MPTASAPFTKILDLPDADATAALGRGIAPLLRAGDVLLLDGPIGAGKTHFARALIRARLGREEDVPSPSFTLVQSYDSDPEIWHTDLYRLGHPDEALELGLDEAFETAITLVEWPDRLGDLTPPGALSLRFRVTNDGDSRQLEIAGDSLWEKRLRPLLDGFATGEPA